MLCLCLCVCIRWYDMSKTTDLRERHYCQVIGVKFDRYGLYELPRARIHDCKTTAKTFQALDGPLYVVSETT